MSDSDIANILSPTSPSIASAVFGSARPRRPSTPKSPPAELSRPTQSQPQTPIRKDRPLPPIPGPAQVRSPRTTGPPPRARPERRPDSPDVETMIARTPRPRRKSSATFHSPMRHTRSNSSIAVPSSWKGVAKSKEEDSESVISDYGALIEKEDESEDDKGDGSESDSSIDIHTPLPHLMFRDGLLSPRSKLLPGGGTATLSMYVEDNEPGAGMRANSVLSLASTAGSTMTKSGIYRDPRDTQRRRVRHRDQQLLRAGMGLTTGLGWSDSEDEDAPSLLTRRLITTSIARQPSVYSATSRAPSQLSKSTSAGNLSHPPPSYSPAPRPGSRPLSRSVSTTFSQYRLSTADSDSVASTSVDTAARPTRSRTQSNASASSIVSSGSRDSSSAPQSVTSSQATTPSRTAVPRPLRLPQTAGMGMGAQPSVTRSTSVTESRPPVASASAKIAGAGRSTPTQIQTQTRQRTRTLSNPGSRPSTLVPPRVAAVSRIVPPRSVSTSIMAPVRSKSTSNSNSTNSRSADPLSEFPLPPGSAGLARPSVNTHISRLSAFTSQSPVPLSAPPATQVQVLNTVGVGPRPRPRTGTGMVYRNSSYSGSSYYETSRMSRASVASSAGKEVGVI
ncbi:hypothetical protein L226DRAFT_95642 [Lentinus tigrinus ALCF2SS1-7]|uniref:Uncharacterized protein n=1 Tax=Lentinus tigrinus ALCF2SS1-6 TaxID=1328759 RepID=A0A5C2RQI0_9APHY|nr:hypothetical protein L227DRAFT_513035 [Lentinus tigrinus ALCF2SS1-6]RPD73703.1 hypothetical protein L226DRAFT_95642 [Lentinus tigrinus ALCF2SS1-7]